MQRKLMAWFVVLIALAVAGFGLPGAGTRAMAQATPIATIAIPPVRQGEVTVAGANIHYEVYGAGEPLILLHGLLGSSLQFVNQIPAFAQHYQVIAIDSRGQGRSTYGDGPITFALMAEDVLGVMDELGIERANVVGWSNGGVIALLLAMEHPERLNKIVAYGANYIAAGAWFDPEAEAMLTAMGARTMQEYLAIAPDVTRVDAIVSELFALNPEWSEAQLGAITTPVLILDGAHDELVTADQPTTMAAWIPGAELVIMPNTGHFALYEQPEEFNRIVLDFLAS